MVEEEVATTATTTMESTSTSECLTAAGNIVTSGLSSVRI